MPGITVVRSVLRVVGKVLMKALPAAQCERERAELSETVDQPQCVIMHSL